MVYLLAAAVFLPLFPLSAALNAAIARLRHPLARCLTLLVWPQVGVGLLQLAGDAVPAYFVPWALVTSAFYAMRLLTMRDVSRWAGYLATSALALTWGLAFAGADDRALHLFAFWFSLPAAAVALLVQPLTDRFGAAYAGLQTGLLDSLPRLSGALVVTVLAAVATPPFPGFFALLGVLHGLDLAGVISVLVIWLVWGWAATKLLQGFVFGRTGDASIPDIGRAPVLALAGGMGIFVLAGVYLAGGGL